ncbi:hypothetical protein ARMGADRAFT_1090919 [Armillaria gallica]|uniref:BZIP domain-containing protein n=1 Tax=Armillaria gallica TaxID=47427 RepID=A0A2H3D0I1_ARMGA|nr:hypothetical protein ARMGADRAFT_1090919 [Armillaria gallica]
MRVVLPILLLATSAITANGSENNDSEKTFPPPPEWSLNPGWGSQGGGNWRSGSWELIGSSGSNNPVGAPLNSVPPPNTAPIPNSNYQPMWGILNLYYGQSHSAHMPGPPGMFYPQNWAMGRYMYPAQLAITAAQDDRMAVDDDHAPLHHPDNLDASPSKKDKGKTKATAEEVQQQEEEHNKDRSKAVRQEVQEESIPPKVLAIARRIHEQDRVRDLEDCLKQVHDSLAHALDHNRRLERELDNNHRGTKRTHSTRRDTSIHEQSSKRARCPPAGPSSDRQRVPHTNNTRNTDAEKRSSQQQPTKPRKKDAPKIKQLTVLPRCLEYLVPREGIAYLCDSRVHNSTISEGSSVDDWLSFLTGNMGAKPRYPDEPKPAKSPSISEADDLEGESDSDSDDEPWYIRWHCDNPLPSNMTNYRRKEREVFLKAEQKRFEQATHNLGLHQYHMALTRWESQPGRLPPSLPSTGGAGGLLERDNGFWGMLGLGFLYIAKFNLVLVNSKALNAG